MTVNYGTSISLNGLSMLIDAANSRSYPGSGTIWSDLSQNKLQGTLTNGPSYSTTFGSSISLTAASSQYVTFGGNYLGLDAQDKSMTAWIYPLSYPTNPVGLVDKDNSASGWGFWISNTGSLWYWPSSGQDIKDSGSLVAPINTWTFVTITSSFSTKTCNFYYNAKLSSTVTNAGATEIASNNTVPLVIGNLRSSTYYFNGYISTVTLYNRVITQAEVSQNFNAGRGRYGL